MTFGRNRTTLGFARCYTQRAGQHAGQKAREDRASRGISLICRPRYLTPDGLRKSSQSQPDARFGRVFTNNTGPSRIQRTLPGNSQYTIWYMNCSLAAGTISGNISVTFVPGLSWPRRRRISSSRFAREYPATLRLRRVDPRGRGGRIR